MLDIKKQISPKQVGLVQYKFSSKGIIGDQAILEWIEAEFGLELYKLEAIPSANLDSILQKLDNLPKNDRYTKVL